VADEVRYFCSRSQMPSHPTLGAFKRAMTNSFGSICFGSLVVSIIQLLKQAASIAQQSEAMDGNIVACCVWAVANCILSLVLWLIEYFNVSTCKKWNIVEWLVNMEVIALRILLHRSLRRRLRPSRQIHLAYD